MYVPTEAYEEERRFALVTLTIHSSGTVKKDISHINTTFNVCGSEMVWNSRSQKILFFVERSLHVYNVIKQRFEEDKISFDAAMEEGTIYATFDQQIFALAHDGLNLKIHSLNEKTSSWELYLQHEIHMESQCLIKRNSSSDMAIILESKDGRDHIYKLNTKTKKLTFFKTCHKMYDYIYVPAYFHC